MSEEPDNSESQEKFDAQFADLISKLGDLDEFEESDSLGQENLEPDLDEPVDVSQSITQRRATAVYLTPVASAEALTALGSLSGLELTVVPSDSGALAVETLNLDEEEWGMALLVESLQDLSPHIDKIASQLSQMIHMPVVVLSALLAPGTDQEPGVTGQVLAGRWASGKFECDLPAGLVVAQMPLIVEDLLLDRVSPSSVAQSSATTGIPRWKALRMLGRGLRKPPEDGE